MPTESNAINAATTGIVGNTGTAFTGTAVTQYNVLTGAATSSTLNNVAPSATSGVPLISQGAASQPVFGTAVVAGGGTGVTTLTGLALGSGTSAFTAVTYTAITSFTPVLAFGGASVGITYSTQTGLYQQIGNIVFIKINITLTSKGSSTGSATITGLPVTSRADSNTCPLSLVSSKVATGGSTLQYVSVNSSATTIKFQFQTVSGSTAIADIPDTSFANDSAFSISGFYFT